MMLKAAISLAYILQSVASYHLFPHVQHQKVVTSLIYRYSNHIPRQSSSTGIQRLEMTENNDVSVPAINQEISTKNKLTKLGQSGLLAYGFLNFSYYSLATIIAWASLRDNFRGTLMTMSVADRYKASSSRMLKLMAVVWAGSQITKAFRLTGSVFLAPYADKALSSFQRRLNLPSRSIAFSILTSALLVMTFMVYGFMIAYTTFIV